MITEKGVCMDERPFSFAYQNSVARTSPPTVKQILSLLILGKNTVYKENKYDCVIKKFCQLLYRVGISHRLSTKCYTPSWSDSQFILILGNVCLPFNMNQGLFIWQGKLKFREAIYPSYEMGEPGFTYWGALPPGSRW